MPAPRDLEPTALTERERLDQRRGEAGFALELMPQSRFDHFNKGTTDHLPADGSLGKPHNLTVAGRHSTGKHPGTVDTRRPDLWGHRVSDLKVEDSADVADRAIRLWESMPPHKR